MNRASKHRKRSIVAAAFVFIVGIGAGCGDGRRSVLVRTRDDGSMLLYEPRAHQSAQNPCYAPDGSGLLITVWHNGYNRGPAGLYRVSAAGGPSTTAAAVLDTPGLDAVNLPGACWNASAGRLAFAFDQDSTDDVWTADLQGNNLTRVTHSPSSAHAQEPTWSPDGRWLTFEVDDDKSPYASIYNARADGSQAPVLVVDGSATKTSNREPSWSPDGTRILFQRRESSAVINLFTVGPDGTNLTRVTDDPNGDTDASWSPDGRWIVYSSDFDNHGGQLAHANLFVIGASGGVPKRVTSQPYYDGAPSWSPDGHWISFESTFSTAVGEIPTGIWRIPAPVLP